MALAVLVLVLTTKQNGYLRGDPLFYDDWDRPLGLISSSAWPFLSNNLGLYLQSLAS